MKNKKIILIVVFLLAIIVAIFLFFVFKNKKTKITIQLGENAAQQSFSEEQSPKTTEAEKKSIANDSEVEEVENKADKNIAVKDGPGSFKIINNLISWGFESSAGRKIDTIIIHSSYNALGGDAYDFKKLLAEYKEYGVAPHYVIDREGEIYRLVAEKNIAYHAGESQVPDGRTGVNSFSIGIEIMCTKSDGPSDAQYAALKNLIADIKIRHTVKYILGHNQIAPGRKDDPWKFDWKKI